MKIGDRVFVHGYVDEIRKDTIIVRNNGGYFGTDPSEVIVGDRPTGGWIKSNLLPNGWNCDNCGSPIMTDDISEMLFCPNCGCEMTPYKGGDSDG